MIIKIVRIVAVLFGFVICTGSIAAPDSREHGAAALKVYYADLNQALASYQLTDVPFEQDQVKVARDDTLLNIAREHRFIELDFFHLAAALYENNTHALENHDGSQLNIGATINLPTVGDLLVAQSRYEKLRVVGEDLDFNHQENMMRNASRLPFGKSLVLIGPHAKDELPSNQVVTLTSYRPDGLAVEGDADFLSRASRASRGGKSVSNNESFGQSSSPETYTRWLDQSQEIIPIADTIPLQDAGEPEITAVTGLVDTSVYSVAVTGVQVVEAAKEPDPEPVVAARNKQSKSVPELIPEIIVDAKPEPELIPEILVDAKPEPEPVPEPKAELKPVAEINPEPGPVINELVEQEAPAVIAVVPKGDIASALAAIEPATTNAAELPRSDAGNGFYLGPPKNSNAAANDSSTDPLSYIVEWDFSDNESVGTALNKLAAYIGYELVSENDMVLDAYSRRLPAVQRRVSGVTAEEAFTILAGRGLTTKFDHVTRSVKHLPLKNGQSIPVAIARTDSSTASAVSAAGAAETYAKFVQQAGISAMLRQFPADIVKAADRHASRCDSTANLRTPDAGRLHNVVIGNLQQKTPEALARNLVDWYESPVGRKVLELERFRIDEAELKEFTVAADRVERIQQIYNNTVTGKGIASIAVELDYAGWSVSGCKQKAESSGDVEQMQKEMIHGQVIKQKSVKLESILRDDMLQPMAFLFSSLSDKELTEYAEITQQHVGIYSELQQSILDAIAHEAKEIKVSAQ